MLWICRVCPDYLCKYINLWVCYSLSKLQSWGLSVFDAQGQRVLITKCVFIKVSVWRLVWVWEAKFVLFPFAETQADSWQHVECSEATEIQKPQVQWKLLMIIELKIMLCICMYVCVCVCVCVCLFVIIQHFTSDVSTYPLQSYLESADLLWLMHLFLAVLLTSFEHSIDDSPSR